MTNRHFEIIYSAHFLRVYKKLHPHLQDEVKAAVEKLRDEKNHSSLRVHKLSGKIKQFHSFSVNYRERIIFEFQQGATIALITVGDHDVYR